MDARRFGGRGLALAAILGMIAMNVLANALPLFGRNTAAVSARYPVLVTPAGYVFAIWGLIYVGMLAYGVAQFVRPLRDDPLPDRLVAPVVLSSVANVAWLFAWHSLNIPLTLPLMLALLASLIWAYVTIRRGRPLRTTSAETWAVRAPFSVYLGWISVATIANVAIVLYALRWNGWGVAPVSWAMIALVIGAALAVTALIRERDVVFALVFVWAFVGIGIQHAGEAMLPWVAYGLAAGVTAAIAAVLVADRSRYARGVGVT